MGLSSRKSPIVAVIMGGPSAEREVSLSTGRECAAALREAHEEIGLAPGNVEVLGLMPAHETVTGFHVTPVIALVKEPFDPVAEVGEVEEVFDVPLDHVLTPSNFSVQSRRWRGSRRHYFTVPFGPYYIWGATARILRSLADALEDQ